MFGGNEHCPKGDDFTLPPVIHPQSLPSAVVDDILPDDWMPFRLIQQYNF